jgi:hypothetical protein
VLKIGNGFVVDMLEPHNDSYVDATVNEKDYQVPFRFTGKLDKLTIKLDPRQLSDADQRKFAEMNAKGHDDR